MAVALLWCAAAAAQGEHRAAAETAERAGRYRVAAREYAAAFEEEHLPDLLYRLGICRRRLKQYAPAREAFRSYLRVAPSGALKDDAERQLAQLDVLLDEQSRKVAEEESGGSDRKQRPPKCAPAPPETMVAPAQPAAPPTPAAAAPAPAPEMASATPPVVAAPIEAPPIAPAAAPRAIELNLAPPAPVAAPPVSELLIEPPSRMRAAVPYVAGASAVVLAAAGAYFWADGARVSNELDSRFAAGTLGAADEARYGRAHTESIAGRVLVAAAFASAAAVVLLWK